MSATLVEVSGGLQFTYAVRKLLFSIRLWNFLRRPLLVSGVMLIVFLILRVINPPILVTLFIAGIAYSSMVGTIIIRMFNLQETLLRRVLHRKPSVTTG